MYINSNFTDYYDFCTKYGQDSKIVYNRKTSKVPVATAVVFKNKMWQSPLELDVHDPSQFLKLCGHAVATLNPSKTYTKSTGWTSSYPISFYCIGGHPYFLIHETHTVVSFLEAWDYMSSKHGKKFSYFSNYSNALGKSFEALCKPEKLMTLHTHFGAPIFGLNYLEYENPQSWTLNPSLKEVKFPVDPVVVYTAIFNSLQAPEPQMLEVDDSYKALAHGMDTGSFKREPGGPTRKRKKSQLGMI
jgi:hypothetical protein